MSSIFDFAQYPTSTDWDDIYEEKKEAWYKIELTQTNNTFNVFDFKGIELSYWIKEFNNRVFDLLCSYVILVNYYKLGIPDDEWYISPGNNGKGVQYFPHFEEKHYSYLYWFGFYMDSYYTKYFSTIDTIYHLINTKYGFGVEESPGFKKKISHKLKREDKDLFDF